MERRSYLKTTALLSAALPIASAVSAAPRAGKKPNLLFIMTDQQRFDTLTVNGNPNMKVPVMDALAKSGANCQGYFTNSPVCVPSRCNLFTGRYPHSHGITENYNLLEAGREIHLFRILKQNGYRIGYAGKNHLLDPQEKENFDYWSEAGYHDETPAEKKLNGEYMAWRRSIGVPPGRSEIWRAGYVHDAPKEATRTYQTAQAGIDFLKKQKKDDPFALCISFVDPHVPHLALREYYEKYPLDEIDLLPFNGEAELEAKARRWAIKYGAFNAQAATEKDKKHYIAVYRAMISWIDTQMGRIFQTLKERNLMDETLIVFTSDHGDFCFEHGLAKKDLVLVDSLLRVPCLFSLKGVIEPKVLPEDVLIEQVDMLPTILDLLDVETPIGVQGTSFAGLLKGETDRHKDAVFAEVCPPYLYCKYKNFDAFAAAHGGRGNTPFNVPGDYTKSIRERDWRYIWYGTGEEELYDHRSDPHELANLASDPKYAAEKERLKMRLAEWNMLSQDPLDPNLLRDLQDRYADWTPLSIQPGTQGKPDWKEMIHRNDLAKKV